MERVQRVLVLTLILLVSSTAAGAREPTLEQRMEAQRAIERVRFEHRIWPAVNPGAKPAFSKAVPDELLGSKVADYLSKSRALETLWGKSIARGDLQAEIDRMARSSRDPRTHCVGTGSYDEGSPSQQGSRDGGIAASPNACP